jgi:hypothetical protein
MHAEASLVAAGDKAPLACSMMSARGSQPNARTDRREVEHVRAVTEVEPTYGATARRSLAALISEAAQRITRLSASEAFAAVADDGLIIDIRSQDARELEGVIRRGDPLQRRRPAERDLGGERFG